ncbi:MAG: CaiB/BaiF CoA-transferase family protein [Pseudomonadota bacterium]|nr:CaiB/BaiF CoA-transferase family protein [Pseudomonadota bacterium]
MTKTGGALSHLRVLDLSRILAGPWATQMLGDLGADIIKVERPRSGDDTRGWGPPFADGMTGDAEADATARSAYFCSVNRNKRSLAIDITSDEGAAILRDLAAECDVLVENFKVGGLAKYGLDYGSVKQINPRLVYCSITGFGQDGPDSTRAGYDFMIQGMGGLMSVTGEPDGMPMKIGVALVDVLTGTNAATAILAAVIHASRTGEGQHIDMSLFDVSVASLANQALNYLVSGNVPGRLGNAHPNIVPYQAFATEDGHIILAVGNDSQFQKFCDVAGLAGVADDPTFATNRARVTGRQTLLPLIEEAFLKHTTGWWLDELAKVGVPAGPINPIDAALAEPQAVHRRLSMKIPDDLTGSVPGIASPLRLAATPPKASMPPPRLGAHSRDVLKDLLSMEESRIESLLSDGIIDEPR